MIGDKKSRAVTVLRSSRLANMAGGDNDWRQEEQDGDRVKVEQAGEHGRRRW